MISITLPSIHQEACSRALANIAETTRGPYEAIVVSPFRPDGANVVWLREQVPQGCAYAHAMAAGRARGAYIVPFADDHEFVPDWSEIAIENFERRERRFDHQPRVMVAIRNEDGHVLPMNSIGPFALGLRGAHSGHIGTNWGTYYCYFPFMRLSDVHRVGWIGQDYQRGFGDSDLSMRVWSAGGRCEWSEQGLIRPTPDDHRKGDDGARTAGVGYTEADLRQFVDRWAPRYGCDWNIDDIDGFNVDLRPSEQDADLVQGNTIFCNHPSFMRRIRRMDGRRLADEVVA